MFKLVTTRIRQGFQTSKYPKEEIHLPREFLGRPALSEEGCPEGCQECIDICPTDAISTDAESSVPASDVTAKAGEETLRPISLDLGRCVFCALCTSVCPENRIVLTNQFPMASTTRDGLVLKTGGPNIPQVEQLDATMRRLFGRSMRIRQVAAGDCGACKDDLNVLNTLVFDLSRFGIQYVASPRHADCLVITGPIPENMRVALEKAYVAMPKPRIVVAVGACAISGGPFRDSGVNHNGVGNLLKVDLYIPGCPPHPYTILDGLLRLLGQLPADRFPDASGD